MRSFYFAVQQLTLLLRVKKVPCQGAACVARQECRIPPTPAKTERIRRLFSLRAKPEARLAQPAGRNHAVRVESGRIADVFVCSSQPSAAGRACRGSARMRSD